MNKNTGVNPNDVIFPKTRLDASTLRVWVEKEDFSIATFLWNGTEHRVGIRWNGVNGSLGYPVSRHKPTWFVLPFEVAVNYIEKTCAAEQVIEFKAAMANSNAKP